MKTDFSKFEAFLESTCTRLLEGVPQNLRESIRYSLLAPGKRVRPRLAVAASDLLGLKSQIGFTIGAAIEMIHCYTLIHDDLPCMDNDDFRRGKPTNHKVYGEAVALLAGDSLMPMAWELLDSLFDQADTHQVRRALARFSWAVGPRGVVAGQAQEFILDSKSSKTEVEAMHGLKTGALFDASILMPLDVSGLEGPKADALLAFSKSFGLAFQAADDLEDLKQDTALNQSLEAKSSERKFVNIGDFAPAEAIARERKAELFGTCDRLESLFGNTTELRHLSEQVFGRLGL